MFFYKEAKPQIQDNEGFQMAFKNKETLRQFWEEGFNKGNLELIPQIVAPDFVNHAGGQGSGPDNIVGVISMLRDAFHPFNMSPGEMVDETDPQGITRLIIDLSEHDQMAVRKALNSGEKMVLARAIQSGTFSQGTFQGYQPTQRSFTDETHTHAFRFDGVGHIIEHWVTRNDPDRLRQLGISE